MIVMAPALGITAKRIWLNPVDLLKAKKILAGQWTVSRPLA
jgi:hypothetical protein